MGMKIRVHLYKEKNKSLLGEHFITPQREKDLMKQNWSNHIAQEMSLAYS